jgi:GntR family transcriptional regulator of abcA and norABC
MYRRDPVMSREEVIAEKIRDYVADNNMRPGERLPGIREFAKLFNAGRETISGAIELLSINGLLLSKPRCGVFVVEDSNVNPNTKIDWEKLKRRSAHFHFNQKIKQFMDYYTDENGDDLIDLSLPYVLKDISTGIPKFADLVVQSAFPSVSVANSCFGQGLLELRKGLSKYMASYGVNADPAQIVISNSLRDAAVLLGGILISNGSAIYYEEPGAMHCLTYLHTLGGVMRAVGTDRYGIKTEELIKAIREEKRGILYTFPLYSFPTGLTASKTRKQEILKITSKADIPIVEMDICRTLDTEAPAPYYAMDKNESTIYVGSFDGILPIGFSLSWIVAPYKLLDLLKDMRFQLGGAVCHTTQLFVSNMLNSGELCKYLEDFKKHIRDASDFSGSILKKHFGNIAKWISVHPLVHWMELPFAGKILQVKDRNIKVVTGDIFSGKHPNHIIVSKVSPDAERYEEAIINLRKLVERFL